MGTICSKLKETHPYAPVLLPSQHTRDKHTQNPQEGFVQIIKSMC